ncbi:hypothetical protein UA32_11845 [Photobacterium angustum]|uniref:Uncharacterized protein n=1 Tax=Photobacterium angustum TaxID=661 RepID=A0ABX5H193_PHOAN|nr:PRTRC system protein C [Photobacterium angustum]KJG37652.1 hypothetical protein UA32_11845 [Photobacterium angustum]PSX07109.1 hypothetical protein C0W27_16190 [Photobacterium angustum]
MLQKIKRKFKIGALMLDDPNPDLTIDQVREIHSKQYPLVRGVTLWESDGEVAEHNGEQVFLYTYNLPPTSVNG